MYQIITATQLQESDHAMQEIISDDSWPEIHLHTNVTASLNSQIVCPSMSTLEHRSSVYWNPFYLLSFAQGQTAPSKLRILIFSPFLFSLSALSLVTISNRSHKLHVDQTECVPQFTKNFFQWKGKWERYSKSCNKSTENPQRAQGNERRYSIWYRICVHI